MLRTEPEKGCEWDVSGCGGSLSATDRDFYDSAIQHTSHQGDQITPHTASDSLGGRCSADYGTYQDKTEKTRDAPTMTYSSNQHMHMHIRTKAA